ncbi:MAG: MerC domain-containing protein [Sphingomonadaceae bacterium]
MQQWASARSGIDRAAMLLSGLCVIHCVASAVVLGLVSSASLVFVDAHVHEIGLGAAIVLAAIGLGAGWRTHGLSLPLALGTAGLILMALALVLPHGAGEAALTITGVCLLGLGHHLNRRAHG